MSEREHGNLNILINLMIYVFTLSPKLSIVTGEGVRKMKNKVVLDGMSSKI
jgi:hypothetical protein